MRASEAWRPRKVGITRGSVGRKEEEEEPLIQARYWHGCTSKVIIREADDTSKTLKDKTLGLILMMILNIDGFCNSLLIPFAACLVVD